ncbi:hypothetical protein DVH05_000310 [Phytophthora capsici]|nr:hypothetical protein DVH05_000310 [Phytophthora capsici]
MTATSFWLRLRRYSLHTRTPAFRHHNPVNIIPKPLKSPSELRREVKNAQAAKRRLKYVTKLKTERQSLREQEVVLSKELDELHRARKRAKSLQQQSDSLLLWKTIARRQLEGKLVAEAQQKSLNQAVVHRSHVISDVEEMVWQRLHNTPMGFLDSELSAKESEFHLNGDDIVLFEDYLQDLDSVYGQTDAVFRACGAEESPVMSYRIGPEWKRDGDLEFVENLDVLLIPFNVKQTCSSLWKSMTHVHQQKDRLRYSGVIDPDNTIAVKFRLRCPREKNEPVGMEIHFVMRRYVEDDQMVLVWRALSDGEGEFSGLHYDETGWCVVRANKTNEECHILMRTVMETFVRFVPMNSTHKPLNQGTSSQFTNAVLASVDSDAAEISRMMDSLLIS